MTHRFLLKVLKFYRTFFLIIIVFNVFKAEASDYNAFGQKWHTLEVAHFSIHFHDELDSVAYEVAAILEEFYDIFRNTYNLTLPTKTQVILTDDNEGNGGAYPFLNTIHISVNGDFFNLRGTHDWLRDVVTHEYAHVISIYSSLKTPAWMPFTQIGYFNHPNLEKRTEALQLLPSEILPPWFVEGIAQYESSRRGADKWDSHRDMFLRTKVLSGTLLSWDHMSVFAGRFDDYENVYNHGFSLVKYIAEKYGYEKIVSILRESAVFYRLNFDSAIKAVLGISGRQLYAEWQSHLEHIYKNQINSIGKQHYGKKINTDGFYNAWPRFSPKRNKIYFLSNGKRDTYRVNLYSYNIADTVKEKKKIKVEMPMVNNFYSIDDSLGRIVFTSAKSSKSKLPPSRGGHNLLDIFLDTLPSDTKAKKNFLFFLSKTERQITKKLNATAAVFSADGKAIAAAVRKADRFFLFIVDISQKKAEVRKIYPLNDSLSSFIRYIYSLDWSANGRHIAISYIDKGDRKIAVFDTLEHNFTLLCNTPHDERDPRYNSDGSVLYFSSDRTGIFNIYRYYFESGTLQQLTNVSGGAFMPDILPDESKLVYVNFDKHGYGIYLLDTLRVISEEKPDSALVLLNEPTAEKNHKMLISSKPYLRVPRQFMLIPTFLFEEAMTQSNNAFAATGSFKMGGVFSLFDPIYLYSRGTTIGGYLLTEPRGYLHLADPVTRSITRKFNYDFGLMATTHLLPITLSLDFYARGITATDIFYDEYYQELKALNYSVSPKLVNIYITHSPAAPLALNLIGSYNRYDAYIETEGYTPLPYNIAKGLRGGTFASFIDRNLDRKYRISPKGIAAKVSYDFFSQKMLNALQGMWMSEVYDLFRFHQISGRFKTAMPSFWYDKHDLYFDAGGIWVGLLESTKKNLRESGKAERLPSGFEPGVQVPGYTYYFRDTLKKSDGKTDSLFFDTVMVSGNTVGIATMSYRFPLWPKSFDRRISFLYFNYLYGALNFNAGAGWKNVPQKLERNDWLLSYGAEVRLEAISFGTIPFMFCFRWDRGIDRPPPLGGNRYSFKIGLSLDDWESLSLPDYWIRPVR